MSNTDKRSPLLIKFFSSNIASLIFSLFLGLFFGALSLKLAGISPAEAAIAMIKGAFSRPHYLAYILIRSTPLILTGLSVAFAFKTGLFNIGSEGQFIVGATTAALLGISLHFPFWIQIPFILTVSSTVAGIYGGIAGFLKAKYQIHEVISTIMLNWIALYFTNYLIFIPSFRRPNTETTEFINPTSSIELFSKWKESPEGMNWLSAHPFWESFLRPPVNGGIFLAIFAAIIIYFVIRKTTFGFKLIAVGKNPDAATYAGINAKIKLIQSMAISGGLAGLAGACHVLGVSKNIALLASFEGYGLDGIAVSLIGANHPLGVILSAFFLGTLKYSGQKLQSTLQAPSEIINIMIGLVILFISVPKIAHAIFQMILSFKNSLEKKI